MCRPERRSGPRGQAGHSLGESLTAREQLDQVFGQLRTAREDQAISLADLTRLTGMDRSALSKLETGQRPNPTVETLMRYADTVGKRLVLSLADG